MRARSAVAVAVCAMGLVVGACGSDDDSDLTTVPTTSTSTAASSTPTASSEPVSSPQDPTLPPPYIEGADWVDTEVGPSLQIRPTRNGRDVSGDSAGDEAWQEVLTLYPDAQTPGMRAQFDCHWTFARLVDPEKASWNLEPDRPVVSESEMISASCNPGFAEEN